MSQMQDTMYRNKVAQCRNLPTDMDRIRLVKNVGEQFKLTPEQAIGFVRTCTDFGKLIECATELQEKTTDEDAFIHLCLDTCQFPEDRVAMCAMLEIEFIPLPKKDEPKPVPVRKSVSYGLGGGHAFLG